MGKDVEDACCEACKVVGATAPMPDRPALRASHDSVKIVVMRAGQILGEVEPTSAHVNVGRVTGNDVVLPSGTISKRQCTIDFVDGDVIVRDGRSTCGTVINGRNIVQPTRLPEGSAILVGDFQLRVVPR